MNTIIFKEKVESYVKIVIGIAVYSVLYLYLPSDEFRQIFLYFLATMGLYFAFEIPLAAIVVNGIGLLLLLTTFKTHWWPSSLTLGFLFIFSMLLPQYYQRLYKLEEINFKTMFNPLLAKFNYLEAELEKIEEERVNQEKEIEKINQLYILGRELVKHLDINIVAEQLQRAILKRPGVKSITVFLKEKNKWVPIACSNSELCIKWFHYIEENEHVMNERKFRILGEFSWLDGNSAVFWPVKIGKTVLAAIFISTESSYASNYIQEGKIFIPQIALGLKRTKLFMEVQDRSREDGLTGVYLRRYFIERFQAEIQRAKRYSTEFSVTMVDIDDFKQVNDRYGHLIGDNVLKGLSRIIKDNVSPGDLICRYGGEEFCVLLLNTSDKEALQKAERIRASIEKKEFSDKDSRFSITVSIGMSNYSHDGATVETLIKKADKAMYWVKENGKNHIKRFKELDRRKK